MQKCLLFQLHWLLNRVTLDWMTGEFTYLIYSLTHSTRMQHLRSIMSNWWMRWTTSHTFIFVSLLFPESSYISYVRSWFIVTFFICSCLARSQTTFSTVASDVLSRPFWISIVWMRQQGLIQPQQQKTLTLITCNIYHVYSSSTVSFGDGSNWNASISPISVSLIVEPC